MRVIAVCFVLALAACGNDSGSSATTDAAPVAESTTTVTASPDTWTASSCVWRWFDRWEVTVTAPQSVVPGTTVELQAALVQGDVSSVGAVGSFMVDGSGPQVVELTVPPLEWPDPKQIEASQFSDVAPSAGTMCDIAFGGQVNESIGFVEMTSDVDPPAADGTPLGELVAAVDSTQSTDAPMFVLAELMWRQPKPLFDRLYVAPDVLLQSITVTIDGTCRAIRSSYFLVEVTQWHGCEAVTWPEQPDGWAAVIVPDDNWVVRVSGLQADFDAVVESLRAFDVPNGEPADGPAIPTNDEWLDGYFADHTEIVELGRYDWHEGTISIVGRTSADSPIDYLEPVTIGVGNYGSSGMQCEEYTIASSTRGSWTDAPPGGYAWFVAHDPGTTFTLSLPGLPTTVALQQASSGEFVGFLDTGEIELDIDLVAVSNAAGNPVPCTQ